MSLLTLTCSSCGKKGNIQKESEQIVDYIEDIISKGWSIQYGDLVCKKHNLSDSKQNNNITEVSILDAIENGDIETDFLSEYFDLLKDYLGTLIVSLSEFNAEKDIKDNKYLSSALNIQKYLISLNGKKEIETLIESTENLLKEMIKDERYADFYFDAFVYFGEDYDDTGSVDDIFINLEMDE